MTVVAMVLSTIVPGSASAAPCVNPNDPLNPRIANNGTLALSDCAISATRLPAMAAALKITAPWAVPRSPTNAASGSGGGMYNDDASGATTELENTLLARNGVNCAGTIGELVSPGNNLDTGTACAFAGIGDQTNVGDANVGLGTLAATGGPSQGSSTFSASVVTHPDAHAHQRGGRCSGLQPAPPSPPMSAASPARRTATRTESRPATSAPSS